MIITRSLLTCGMIVMRLRRSWSPISVILTPSTVMMPPAGSMRRNRPIVREDLPAPVRPTIPTCRNENIIPFQDHTHCKQYKPNKERNKTNELEIDYE